MMNKKLLIGIIAGVAALIVIVVAIVGISNGLFKFNKNGSSASSATSSQQSALTSGGSLQSESSDSGSKSSQASSTASAIKKGSVSIGTAQASTGKETTINVKISDNPGIVAAQLNFTYDNKSLTFVKTENGEVLDDCESDGSSGTVKCVLINNDVTSDVKKNGTIVSLTFKVNDDAKAGNYDIKLADDSMLCNSEEVTVSPKIEAGSITVK